MANYKSCAFCGKLFIKKQGKKYCSADCSNEARRQRRNKLEKEKRAKERANRKDYDLTCEFCCKQFKSSRRVRFCSTDCRSKHSTLLAKELDQARPFTDLIWQKARPRQPCINCGVLSNKPQARTFCSRECCYEYRQFVNEYAKDYLDQVEQLKKAPYVSLVSILKARKTFLILMEEKQKEHQRSNLVCKQCGKVFKYKFGRVPLFCSRECLRRWCKQNPTESEKEAKRSTANNRKRARTYGCEYDSSIRRLKVFERDDWRCQICGVYTPKNLIGTFDDRAPELDHIVPMSKGGGHVWSNVQCACRSCNIKKGSSLGFASRLILD